MNTFDIEEILSNSLSPKESIAAPKMTANEFYSAVLNCVLFQNSVELKNLFDNNPNKGFSNSQVSALTKAVLEGFNKDVCELLNQKKVFVSLLDMVPYLATSNTEMIAYCVEQLNKFEEKFKETWSNAFSQAAQTECGKRLVLTNTIIGSVFIKHPHLASCEPIRQWFLDSTMYATDGLQKVHCISMVNMLVKGLLSSVTFDERLSDIFDKNNDFWNVFDKELFCRLNTNSKVLFKNLNKHPVFKDKVFNRDRSEWRKQEKWMSSLNNCQTSDEEMDALNAELKQMKQQWPYVAFYSSPTQEYEEGYLWGPTVENEKDVQWSEYWKQMGFPLRSFLLCSSTELKTSHNREMWFDHERPEVYPSFLHGIIAYGHTEVLGPLLDDKKACAEITRILREENLFLMYFTCRTSWDVIKQLVKAEPSWAEWTDKNGNTLAHYMMGFAPYQLYSNFREDRNMVEVLNHLDDINPKWLIAQNNNGVMVKDLLLKNSFANMSSNLETLVSQKMLHLAVAEHSRVAPSKTVRKL